MGRRRFFHFWFLTVAIAFGFGLSSLSSLYALGPGTTGAQFLKIGPGARAVAMGEAFVAIADEPAALYWNPAGIVQIKTRQVSFMHNFWFQGVNYEHLAYVQELPGPGNEKFGFSLIFLHSGDMVRTLEDASGNYAGTGNNFSASDLCLSFSYAWDMGYNHSLGVNLKFINSSIDDVAGNALAVDMGYLFRATPWLSVGINAQNGVVSMPIRFYRGKTPVSASHSLPINGKIGLAYKLMQNRFIIALDFNFPVENRVNYHIGAEYRLTDSLFLRAGYKTDFAQDNVLSGLSIGAGYTFKGYTLDYAFVPYGDLGFTHRISVLVKF